MSEFSFSTRPSVRWIAGLFCGFAYQIIVRIWLGDASHRGTSTFDPSHFPTTTLFLRYWDKLFVWPGNLLVSCIVLALLIFDIRKGRRAWLTAAILGTLLATILVN